MMTGPGLKPCPFCGEAPDYREHFDEDLATHNQVVWKTVSCLNDCASVSIPDDYEGGTALERWNTRTSAHPVTVEMLAAILWREQAVDTGTPRSVIRARTPEAFADASEFVRGVFLKYASAAIAAMKEMK